MNVYLLNHAVWLFCLKERYLFVTVSDMTNNTAFWLFKTASLVDIVTNKPLDSTWNVWRKSKVIIVCIVRSSCHIFKNSIFIKVVQRDRGPIAIQRIVSLQNYK